MNKNNETITNRLRVWKNDIVAFAQEALRVQHPSTGKIAALKLEPHQAEALREATTRDANGNFQYSTVVFSWPKREGKSLLSAIIVTWRTACFQNQKSVILANSERQAASVIYDEVIGFFRNSPLLTSFASEDEIGVKKLTVSMLGNEITCLPCNYRTVQGYAVTGVLAVDELHAVQDIRAFNFLASQTEMLDVQVVVSSQAGSPEQNNPVWRLYQAQDNPQIYFNYSQSHMAPWAIRLAQNAKVTLSPVEYASLHENSWGGLGQKLFLPDHINTAAMEYEQPATKQQWDSLRKSFGFGDKAHCEIGWGLDRAGVGAKGDRTVLTATARFYGPDLSAPEFRVIAQEVFLTGAEAEILSTVDDWLSIFGHPAGILLEAYGCSDIVEKIRGADLIPPTPGRQKQIFNAINRIVSEGRFGFPENIGWDYHKKTNGLLKAELLAFEYGLSDNGNMRYGTQNGHDDTVYSLAWSIEAIPGKIGIYEYQPWGMARKRYEASWA